MAEGKNHPKYRAIPILIFVVGSAIIVGGPLLFNYLDTRVYQPIGTLSQGKAFYLKEIGLFVGLPFLLSMPAAFILIPLFGFLSFRLRKNRLKSLVFLIIAVLSLESALVAKTVLSINRNEFRKVFTAVANRTENLISAIEEYKIANGEYPSKLEDLTPTFISSIPNTGLAGYPAYEYKKADDKAAFKNYELLIQTSIGILNWDVFVYWPEGNYPEQFYGGYPELFGKWAYVHE